MRIRYGTALIIIACVGVPIFGISGSLSCRIHASLLGDNPSLNSASLKVARVRSSLSYAYGPITGLIHGLQVSSTWGWSSEATTFLTTLFCEPNKGDWRLANHPGKERPPYVAMDNIAKVDGPGQFDITQ